MEPSRNIQRDYVIHDGTDLLLCHGTRHVRVLTLPRLCNNRRLLHGWTACLGDEPEEVSGRHRTQHHPGDPAATDGHPHPSR